MRRLIAIGAVALLVLAVAAPLTSAGTTPVTKHVEGTVVVTSADGLQTWNARFDVRTTSGTVQFGYLELYGIEDSSVAGQIHEFTINHVDYSKTPSGAQSAGLDMRECKVFPWPDGEHGSQCWDAHYTVTDGSAVRKGDTFQAGPFNWNIRSGNISIYSTGGQNGQ